MWDFDSCDQLDNVAVFRWRQTILVRLMRLDLFQRLLCEVCAGIDTMESSVAIYSPFIVVYLQMSSIELIHELPVLPRWSEVDLLIVWMSPIVPADQEKNVGARDIVVNAFTKFFCEGLLQPTQTF